MDANEVWLRVSEPLQRFIVGRTKDPEASGDILQNVYLRMQAGLPRLQDHDKIMPWLYRIAANAIADHYRARQRTLQLVETPEAEAPAAEEEEAGSLTHEFATCIPRMLEVLPEKYREALYLTEIQGLSQKELAEQLGISYSGAKSRVQRGREKLRQVLLECCYIHTDVYGNIIDYGDRRACTEENC